MSKIIKVLKRQLRLKDFDSKNMCQSHFQPFHKGKIKIKNEVVPLGLKLNSKNKKLNRYISGKSWNKLISNKETLVVDARKPFEYDVGTFKKSLNPKPLLHSLGGTFFSTFLSSTTATGYDIDYFISLFITYFTIWKTTSCTIRTDWFE